MYASYGYVKRTDTEDGEELDVYVGDEPNPTELKVYKIEQLMSPFEAKKTGGVAYKDHDEFKYGIGFASQEEAVKIYAKCMSKKFVGEVTEMSWESFKKMVSKNIVQAEKAK